MIDDWDRFPNFAKEEFQCSHCGREDMDADFVEALQNLRTSYGRTLTVSSGFRCPDHPVEARKTNGPGSHASGCAADLAVSRADAIEVLRIALSDERFRGFGIQQKGAGRFIHLDSLEKNRPAIWSY